MRRRGPAASLAGLLCIFACSVMADVRSGSTLTVCADPNNLPFSNRAQRGFENKLAALIARDLQARIRYVWWAQRRGYLRNTLTEAKCDLWPGVAAGIDRVATSRPYYRSTYVFVSRDADPLAKLTLDDPRLAAASIGVQMIGNDANNSPPAHAIAHRGLVNNVRGYMLYGDYRQPNPPAAIVEAVAHGEIDVALVWGPLAGYFAHQSAIKLRIEPIVPAEDPPWPMQFDIAMGVRPADSVLLGRINSILERERPAIRRLLASYHVPEIS